MKTALAAALGVALLTGGIAMAQNAAPPPGPAAGPPGDRGPMDGPGGERRGPPPPFMRGMMERMMHRPPPTKAAIFHFRKGDARVDIKCADDEPTKACIDAASALMDKLAAQPK